MIQLPILLHFEVRLHASPGIVSQGLRFEMGMYDAASKARFTTLFLTDFLVSYGLLDVMKVKGH